MTHDYLADYVAIILFTWLFVKWIDHLEARRRERDKKEWTARLVQKIKEGEIR